MTTLAAGVVDVFVVRPRGGDWQILCLRRAIARSRAGAWEMVTGRVEAGEHPVQAARREVREETGLALEALWSIGVESFYLPSADAVQHALLFVGFVADDASVTLDGHEHDAAEWLPLDAACDRMTWPWARRRLREGYELLRAGNAGVVDDVTRA
jgi:8-oxo-dGTP pyrophosphatase MutT (NUDIX family)